MSSATSKEEM
jgi:hypothetical protein